jgi:hypothetical protein
MPAAFQATTPTADQIRSRLDEGPIWVAEQAGAVVGTIGRREGRRPLGSGPPTILRRLLTE